MMNSGQLTEELYQSAACLSQHSLREAEQLRACILHAYRQQRHEEENRGSHDEIFNLDLA